MKRYIELQKHEELADGDECRYVYSEEWRPNVHRSQMVGFEYRRLVPHTGDVQFLMCVSILVPVTVSCDGLAQDEIEMIAGDAVIRKIKGGIDSYVCHENIDWSVCKVDDVEPFNTDEPKNPGKYRHLEVGEIVQAGDETITTQDDWTPVEGSIGVEVWSGAEQNYRRPITEPQYRPFLEGEIMEMGDQFRFDKSSEWRDLTEPFTTIADDSIIRSGDFRKLIK